MARKTRRAPAQSRKIDKSTYRIYQGKEVKPTMYSYQKENTTGRRTITAGTIDGEIVRDKDGRAMPYKSIPNERQQ